MISDAKLEANRRNAQKSTGPRTAEGKARSAKNATTHGLFAADNVIRAMGETDEEYLRFKDTLLDAFHTEDPIDRVLAEDFINCHWRLRRVRQMEAGYLDSMCHELIDNAKLFPPAPDYSNTEACPRAGDFRLIGNAGSFGNLYLNNLSRYESRLRAASYRALAEIDARKIEPTADEQSIVDTPEQPTQTGPPDGKIEPTNPLAAILENILPLILLISALFAAPSPATAATSPLAALPPLLESPLVGLGRVQPLDFLPARASFSLLEASASKCSGIDLHRRSKVGQASACGGLQSAPVRYNNEYSCSGTSR